MTSRIIRNMMKATAALLAVCILAGCRNDDTLEMPEQPTPEAIDTYEIAISITSSAIISRAEGSWGDEYPSDNGSAFDNRISILDMWLVAPDGSEKRLKLLLKHDGETGGPLYTCQLEKDSPALSFSSEGEASLNGKIVARANIGDSGAGPFEELLFDIKFGDPDWLGIPMWGVASFNGVKLETGKTNNLGTIHLLRSVAKLSVKFDTDKNPQISQDYRIKSVTRGATSPDFVGRGKVLPSGSRSATSTLALGRIECFNPYSIKTPIENFRLTEYSDSRFIGYVAESETTGDRPFSLHIELEPREGKNLPPLEGDVYLARYMADGITTGQTFDKILRNYEYEFLISFQELQIITTVDNWYWGWKHHIEL